MPIPVIAGGSRIKSGIVIPSREHRHLRCGQCGGMDFGVHVEPRGRGGAVAREVVCRGCRKVFKFRPDLAFERGGQDNNLRGESTP